MPLLLGWLGAGSRWLTDLTDACAAIQRTGSVLYPGASRFHGWRRTRFWLRSLICWRTTNVWLKRCSSTPLLDLVKRHPATLERMHRPFPHGRFTAGERLAASLDHHTLTQCQLAILSAQALGVRRLR